MIKILVVFYLFLFGIIYSITAGEFREGNITLKQLIAASKAIANALPQQQIDKKLAGTIININDQKYEIRYFCFNDVRLKLPRKMSFKKYIYKNKLSELKSLKSSPIPNVDFETFDYRMTQISNDIFFSISLRIIDAN